MQQVKPVAASRKKVNIFNQINPWAAFELGVKGYMQMLYQTK